jgi:very-short-patch-repair endonuclease
MRGLDRIALYHKAPKIKRLWKKQRDKLKIKPQAQEVLQKGIETTSDRVKWFADQLRRHQTRSERKFRALLVKCKLDHLFKSQVPMFGYILDFYCPELMLCVEIDGKSHKDQREYDEQRSKVLWMNGIKVIRFKNATVKNREYELMSTLCQAVGVSQQLARVRKSGGKKRSKVYLAGEYSQEQLGNLVPSFKPSKWDGPKEPYVPKWLS